MAAVGVKNYHRWWGSFGLESHITEIWKSCVAAEKKVMNQEESPLVSEGEQPESQEVKVTMGSQRWWSLLAWVEGLEKRVY
jgi:hypothetical protein